MMKIIIVFFLILSGLSGKEADNTAGKTNRPEKVVLLLNWKFQFEFAGFIAAKEKGFYREAGMNVEIREFSPGMDVVSEVLGGRADYGLYSSKLQKRFTEGEPVKLLASFFKKPSMVIISRKNLKKPENLVGKKILIGMRKKDFFLNFKEMFQNRNADISRMNLVESPYSMQAFIDGKVDAMVVFITSQLYKLDSCS